MLLAGDTEAPRYSASGDQHEAPFEHFARDFDRARTGEASTCVKSVDATLGKALLLHRRHRLSKAAFEGDQISPFN
jgi:hypothetical protein